MDDYYIKQHDHEWERVSDKLEYCGSCGAWREEMQSSDPTKARAWVIRPSIRLTDATG